MRLSQRTWERIWLWWHTKICQPLRWVMRPDGLGKREGRIVQWLGDLQIDWICGPLDDRAHDFSGEKEQGEADA